MNPLAARASGYRSYDEVGFEFPTGCTVIVGPNGSGKSSLLELVPLALFGSPSRSLSDYLNTKHDEMTIELVFEHGNATYRVRRWFSAKGRGKTTLDFETEVGGVYQPLTRETSKATQALIEETLGISRSTFLASAYLSQGDGDRFTAAEPAERKAVLAEILNLSIWDRLLDRARAELRLADHEIAGAAVTVDRLEQAVAAKPAASLARDEARTAKQAAAAAVATGEAALESAQEQIAAVAAANERALARKAELEAAKAAHSRLQEQLSEATAAARQLGDVRVELEEVSADADRIAQLEQGLTVLQEEARAAREARRRHDELAVQAEQREAARARIVDQALTLNDASADARRKADHLDRHMSDAGDCDRCGQKLGAEAATRAAQSYRVEAGNLDRQAAEFDAQAEADLVEIADLRQQLAAIAIPETVGDPLPVEAELAAARVAVEKRAQLQERLGRFEELAARLPRLQSDAEEAAAAVEAKRVEVEEQEALVGDLAAAERSVSLARSAVRDAHATLQTRTATLARAEQQLEQIAAAAVELDQLRSSTRELQARVDVLKLAERAYGRDGIPALIVENAAIPQLELEANRILGELGGATAACRIELRTQRALKTSEQLRETLDIVIRTPTGDRPYESFSGGERTRLNLALRIALARLLAHRRGAESRLLAIDEPEFLDEHGTARLGDVLRGLAGDFDRILLVSHHPTLAAAFDEAITVVKDGERSRIDIAVPEAVVA